MLKNITIRTKITLLIFAISLLVLIAASLFTYQTNIASNEEEYSTTINALADSKSELASNFFDRIVTNIKLIQSNTTIEASQVAATYSVDAFLKTDKKGGILFSSDTSFQVGSNFIPDGSFVEKASEGIHFSFIKKKDSSYYLFVGAPLDSTIIIAKVALNPLFKYLSDVRGLRQTGEVFMAQFDENLKQFIIVSPLRSDPAAYLKTLPQSDKAAKEFELALNGKQGSGLSSDYRHKEVFQAWRKVNNTNFILIAKIDAEEALASGSSLIQLYVYLGLATLLLAVAVSFVFSNTITAPLTEMRNTLEMVSKGILPENTGARGKDEFGQMAVKVDDLVTTIKGNAEFAQKVGEGKFDAPFKPASENDILGLALLGMRNNLVENEKKENERNWIIRGLAEAGEILRSHDNLDALGEEMVTFVLPKIGAVQGAFYLVNDDKSIELRTTYAFNRKKYIKRKFRFAEGLVGQAVAEQDTIIRTEIPDDYMSITSGLMGDNKPTCLLICPQIANEEVYGVMEFAGFKKFDASHSKFVQELSMIMARTIFNIRVNERTRRLLSESQELSNELKEKTEVLRQNAEEMQATQEELRRSNLLLEEQVEEVNKSQKRQQLLLENASEVITIYEEDGVIRYISPSVESILGYSQREMQGAKDIDLVHPDKREIYTSMFAQLVKEPAQKVTVQFEYRTKEGNFIWLEATGTNFMSNPVIHGFILNSRDITERRRAEQEQRMRSKMQALSENSPDLIARLEHDSISYINPVIESYTGKHPHSFLNRNVRETELDIGILESWLNIVERVNQSSDTISTEMDFPSIMGDRVMQVNAIPEYDENKNIESVLVVSHDITERKLIELEIQNKNKKINDSINYAKRIQNAILPSSRLIRKALKDSFILYKPRDVVSGDFPWFVQIKDDIFIAAVDCTGHGVPGALLSLIGYFLLNDIVRSRKVTDPGKILDLLDEGVTQTLRQDQDDSATKDGMDIALCRIQVATRELEYSGAHRPLYIMKAGVMDEVKGNKFPIGGGIFKNQTNFTTTKIQLEHGDSVYFSSDGFPDQFGGPENRKFGPKKTREIVERVHNQSMAEAEKVFDLEWETWRGETKQTDDVLLIGIKF
jgi:PAS domain S-box-containing protein